MNDTGINELIFTKVENGYSVTFYEIGHERTFVFPTLAKALKFVKTYFSEDKEYAELQDPPF